MKIDFLVQAFLFSSYINKEWPMDSRSVRTLSAGTASAASLASFSPGSSARAVPAGHWVSFLEHASDEGNAKHFRGVAAQRSNPDTCASQKGHKKIVQSDKMESPHPITERTIFMCNPKWSSCTSLF